MPDTADSVALASLRKLCQSEETFGSFLQGCGLLMGILEVPADGGGIRHVYHSPATERFFGYVAGSMTGACPEGLRAPERALKSWIRKCRKSERTDGPVRFRYRHERSQAVHWLKLSLSRMKDADDGSARFAYVGQDITDAVRASRERRESEARYKKLFETSPQPMWIFDKETLRIVQVNAAAIRHYGYAEQEFLGLTIADIRPAEDVPRLRAIIASRAVDRPTLDGLWRHIKKDGSVIDVEILGHEVEFEGRPARWVMITDVTERLRTERELKESQERLAAALKAGRLGVFEFSFRTRELIWDSRVRELWGLDEDEPATEAIFEEGIHPDDRPAVLRAIKTAALRPGMHAYAIDYRVRRRKDGVEIWIHAEGDVIWLDGIAMGLVGTVQDITAQKRTEAILREQQGLYKSVTDNASLALFIMDDKQQCVFMNPAAEKLTGFSLAALKGRPLHDYIHHTHPDGTPYPLEDCPIDQALPRNDRETGEEVFVHKDGHFYDVKFTASPIRDHRGVAVGTVIEVEDITARKRADRQIMLLMREVNHRSKNMLAVVQSIATQTASRSDPEAFAKDFSDRLQSLAASHDLLVTNNWRGVGIAELVRSQLKHLGASATRINAEGPDLQLSPSVTQALGLALHELGTNAAKYGSLSGDGCVHITWGMQADGNWGMCWRESGGPPVVPPRRKGFGSRLIREMTQISFEGQVAMRFEPEGLVWELTAPLEKIVESRRSNVDPI